MEWIERPTFINGTVNKLPYPELPEELKNSLAQMTFRQRNRVKFTFNIEEKSTAFTNNDFFKYRNLLEFSKVWRIKLNTEKKLYEEELKELNELVYDYFGISKEDQQNIDEITLKAGNENEGKAFEKTEQILFDSFISILIGSIFGRWDISLFKYWKEEWSDEDIFKARNHSPFLYGARESTLDLVLPEYHDQIREIWDMPYPIKVLEDVATVSDINPVVGKLKEVIQYFWPETFGTIEEELMEHFKVNELSEIFDKHSKFFDAHLKDYSRNKRISPIYWHVGVPSGKFNVWVYYPKLNDASLFKMVNELVEPKIKEITKEVEVLEMNGSGKEYADQKLFLAELEDFKEEILRVAHLPYRPNQDDGVLITAAPLHNLFRHTKWKKATQDCWKQLEKGEYDWAHLAYSIWPERVRKKCEKDLSMAIAHGLEEICAVKPKETQGKL